jgi:hypothetical protein
MLNFYCCTEDILSLPSSRPSGYDAESDPDGPHKVSIYLPPTLFAYLVERGEREGVSLAAMIVDLLDREHNSHRI